MKQKKIRCRGLPFCGVHTIIPTTDTALSKDKATIEELSTKLQTLDVQNVNKQIKTRDIKLVESQTQAKKMERERTAQDKTIHNLDTQLQISHTLVHCLCQRLSQSNRNDNSTVQENSTLRTELYEIDEHFSCEVTELEANHSLQS